MQPEEIIQQKEWHLLTEEEKQVLKPLASDEQEFNLLKKMLLVADETVIDVPQIAPAIQQQLHHSLKSKAYQKVSIKKWYYAAAAILLIAVSTWLLLRTEKDTPAEIVHIPNNPEIRDSSIHRDSSLPKKEAIQPEVVITRKPIPVPSPQKIETPPIERNRNNNQQIHFSDPGLLLKDDSSLMAFVTEVY